MLSKQMLSISPMVLLSVVDHYKRLSTERVVGVLLGSADGDVISVTKSFAVPFEESGENLFLDTSYLQNMFDLYYKVNCKEKIVGLYHSGPELCATDPKLASIFLQYTPSPVLAVINVHMRTDELPCRGFLLDRDEELLHIKVHIRADETEEVGIEHLLRDIKEGTGTSLKDKLNEIRTSLRTYEDCLETIIGYLGQVERGERKMNKRIANMLQMVLNSVPRYSSKMDLDKVYVAELARAFVAMGDHRSNKAEMKNW